MVSAAQVKHLLRSRKKRVCEITLLVGIFIEAGFSALWAQGEAKDKVPLQEEKETQLAEPQQEPYTPHVLIQYYWDNRDYNTLGVTVSGLLPWNFRYWGFTDLNGTPENADERFDMARSFSEYRLMNSAIGDILGLPGLSLVVEYNDLTPRTQDDELHFGVAYFQPFWIPEVGPLGGQAAWMAMIAFPYHTDSRNKHVTIAYEIPIHSHVVLDGFVDYNVVPGARDKWVIEPQLNILIKEPFWIALEYRYNGFEKVAGLHQPGIALGVRLKF